MRFFFSEGFELEGLAVRVFGLEGDGWRDGLVRLWTCGHCRLLPDGLASSSLGFRAAKTGVKATLGSLNGTLRDREPLHCAASKGHRRVVEVLLDEGKVDINRRSGRLGNSPMLRLCFFATKRSASPN